MVTSGVSVRHSVSPGWPFCPPVFLPDGSRKLLTRTGFFSPSLDGGLPLLLLFRPRRRSSSATRAKSTCLSPTRSAFCTFRCSMSACKAAMFGGSPVTVDAGSGTGRSDSACVTDACRLRPRRDLSRTISAGDLGSYHYSLNQRLFGSHCLEQCFRSLFYHLRLQPLRSFSPTSFCVSWGHSRR